MEYSTHREHGTKKNGDSDFCRYVAGTHFIHLGEERQCGDWETKLIIEPSKLHSNFQAESV